MSLRSTAPQPSSVSGAGGASTSSAPRPRHSSSVASKPRCGVGVELADPRGDAEPKARERTRRDRPSRSRHPGEEQRAVLHRACHRACVVEARRERDDPAHRDGPARRLDRRGAAERRRDPQRAGGVGARRRGCHPRGERRARAAARPAGRAVERPRVPDLVGRAPGRELVRVQMTEQHHPLGLEPSPDVTGALRHLVEEPARRGQRLPGDGVDVLEPDRDAAERRRVAAPEPLVRPGRGGERVVS